MAKTNKEAVEPTESPAGDASVAVEPTGTPDPEPALPNTLTEDEARLSNEVEISEEENEVPLDIDNLTDDQLISIFNIIPDSMDDEILGKIRLLELSGADKDGHENNNLDLAAKDIQIAIAAKAAITKVSNDLPQNIVLAIASSYVYAIDLKDEIIAIQ